MTLALFENIANFLSESPEWVENWTAAPVKKVIPKSEPSLDFADFAVSFFNNLPLDHFDKNLTLVNWNWHKECKRELEERRKFCIKKYWETVEEHREAKKALDNCWINGAIKLSRYCQIYDKFYEYKHKKDMDFLEWVNIDQICIGCGFPDLIDNENPKYYIQMYYDGLDPDSVPSLEEIEAWNRGEIEDFD